MTSSSAPWHRPTSQPDLNHRRCHVMTANVQTGSAQRLGKRAAAWFGISLVQTHWLPVILTGRCLDQAPWLRRRKNESDPTTAHLRRRTTLSESPSRHWVRWETKRRNLSATSAVGLLPQPQSLVLWPFSSSTIQRGNSASVTGICAPSAKLNDIFYIV